MLSCNETIAVAESVTAGYLQAALSIADNALQFFQGGITAYNIGQKCRHLHIDPIYALSCNCVSEKVANEMAINVTKSFISDWGMAITGYASKVPEMSINSLFAYYAICYKNEIVETKKIYAEDDSDAIHAQLYYANETLNRLYAAIEKSDLWRPA